MPSWRCLSVPSLGDARGGLAVYECRKDIPFDIRRIFFLYDLPKNSTRGHHAHKQQEQVVICVQGRCSALLDDSTSRERVILDSACKALYVPPMIWLELDEFEPGTVLVAATNDFYDETDYVRDYAAFRAMVKAKREGRSDAVA